MKLGLREYVTTVRRDKTAKWLRPQLYWYDPFHLGRKPKSDKYKSKRKGR